jgi:signal transduction histidine kinase
MLETAGVQVQDIAVPILGSRVGTAHVGMSLRRLQDTLSEMTRRILLTTLWVTLLAMIVTATATWLFTRPMLALAEAIRRTARGDLTQRLVPWADDEIGLAQGSFNVMVERLAHFRREMESAHDRLLRRNRELSALNAISRAIAGPLALTDVLERALQQAMGLVRAGGGWICLLTEDAACRVGVSAREPFRAEIGTSYCQKCAFCQEAARTHQPVVVAPLPPECPLHATRGIGGHAIVPLLVKDQAVGLLNLICGEEDGFEIEDLSLLVELGRQLGVAIENARLWEELQDKEAMRGQLLRKIITAQEEERRRISRELHDEAGQALTSLLIGLKTMEKAEGMDQVRALISDLREVLNQTLDKVHDLAVELRPSVLDDLGLVPALARYVSGCSLRFGFEAEFETAGLDGRRLPPEVEITLYRIAQETLTNVARHANARHASVLLQRRKGAVVLVVEDDGEGFDVDPAIASAQEQERLGLYGVEERALLVGGLLTIESRPGAGATVSVEIPLEGVWSAQEGTANPRETQLSAS